VASKTTAIDFDDHQVTSRKESLRQRTRLHRYRSASLSHECLPLPLLSRRTERKRRPVAREGDDRSSPSSSATSRPDVRYHLFFDDDIIPRLFYFPINFLRGLSISRASPSFCFEARSFFSRRSFFKTKEGERGRFFLNFFRSWGVCVCAGKEGNERESGSVQERRETSERVWHRTHRGW